jgi:APA family basic amino acid/polyamine antiporter
VIACGLMVVLLGMNYCGVRPGARAQNLLSSIKIVMIVGLAALALLLAPHHQRAEPAVTSPLASRLSSALIPCFYAYGGYHLTMNLGADLKDARRRFPLAITAGVVIVVTLYVLLNVAYQRVLGIEGIADSKLVAAVLSRATFGPYGETLVSIAVFLSAAGFVNATVLQMPRSFYAMAQDGVLPRSFLRVNPVTQVQEVALLFFGFTMLLPAFLLGSFEKLLSYVIFIDMLTLTIVASTIFVLRRRVATESYAMPGYPLLPLLYIACLLGVAGRDFTQEPILSAGGVAILLTGWPLFKLGHRLFHGP